MLLRSNKQIVTIIVLLSLAFIFLVAYHLLSNLPEKNPIRIRFADRMSEAHLLLIDKFNAENADSIKVIPIDFPKEDFSTDARKEVLARSLRGDDDAIDVFAVDLISVHRFTKWCEPLGKYFTEDERKKITSEALKTCYYEGELVAIPLDLVQSVMYYRTDLLQKYDGYKNIVKKLKTGITWPEMVRLKNEMGFKGPFYIYPAADYEGLTCSFIEILLSLRSNYFETEGFHFNTKEAYEALQLLVNLVYKYRLTPSIVCNFTEIPSYEYFIRSDGLFIRGWTSYDKDFERARIDSMKEKFLCKVPIPYPYGGKPISLFGGWNLMLAKSCKNKTAAVKFIKFLLSNEAQELLYSKSGFYPVVCSFYNDSSYINRYPEIREIKILLQFGVHRPLHENYTRYSRIMARYVSLAIAGKISVDEALSNIDKSIGSEEVQLNPR